MDNIAHRVRTLGLGFNDRIESWRLAFALEYIDFNELPLAFETLYTYIYEYGGNITSAEYQELIELARALKNPLNSRMRSVLVAMISDRF